MTRRCISISCGYSTAAETSAIRVDGGVFDMPQAATELVIPIHAALPVLSAKAFAVTVEKPGGVVVSGREHVVALGAAG